jgi:uncharacterized protein (TIGR00251 family)
MKRELSEIAAKIIPQSSSFSIGKTNEWTREITLHVKAPPQNGRANREIENELKRLLGIQAEIVSGHKSPHKKIRFHAPIGEVEQKLAQYAAPKSAKKT